MKITMYELLGMIKEGKAPSKIKYDNYYCYYDSEKNEYVDYAGVSIFDWGYVVMNSLNCEIEIIEEPQEHKIPEKLNLDTDELRGKEVVRSIDYLIEDKINEILDYLEEIE